MNASARPTRLDSTISPLNEVEEFRSLFCPRYESCLDFALRLGWKSWTCVGCEMFGADVPRDSKISTDARPPFTEDA